MVIFWLNSAMSAVMWGSGFAAGVDLIFAGIVADLKREYPITLEAAIPYPGRMDTPDKAFTSDSEWMVIFWLNSAMSAVMWGALPTARLSS